MAITFFRLAAIGITRLISKSNDDSSVTVYGDPKHKISMFEPVGFYCIIVNYMQYQLKVKVKQQNLYLSVSTLKKPKQVSY